MNLLFRASAATPLEIAADPKHLGAEIGFMSVLHKWGQNVLHHPHAHCVIPAGGLSLDHQHWVRSRYRFFLPVGVLNKVFRGKFLEGLKRAYRRNKFGLGGATAPLKDPTSSGLFFNLCIGKTGSSMSSQRCQALNQCFVIWGAIPTALPSAITGSFPSTGKKSHSAGRIMHTETSNAS